MNQPQATQPLLFIVLGSLKLLSKLFLEKFAGAQLSNVAGVFFLE